jgi:HSP20 family molecular chaperone IbpA
MSQALKSNGTDYSRLLAEMDTDDQSYGSVEHSREGTDDENMEVDEQADETPLRTASQAVKQLEVEQVQLRVSDRIAAVDGLREKVSQLEENSSSANTLKLSQEALADIDAMRKLARNYNEDLLEDMLALDKLSGLTPDDRASRKAVISQIEAMMDILDGAKSKLSLLYRKVEETLKTLMALPAPFDADTEQPDGKEPEIRMQYTPAPRVRNPCQQQPQQHVRQEPKLSTTVPTKDFWKRVSVRMPFRISDAGNKYMAEAPAPGVNTKGLSVEISNQGRHLLVRGIRLPTSQEALDLQESVQDVLRHKHLEHCAQNPEELIRHLYIQAGQGSFGAFAETLQIPEDADIQGIRSSHQEDKLRVVIPKVPRHTRAGMFGSRPHMPYPARYHARNPFRDGLFADMW